MRTTTIALACIASAACGLFPRGSPPPAITITLVPPYGATTGFLRGEVTGVDPMTHRVAPFLHVEGMGWFSKPSLAQPTVAIEPTGPRSGTFSANVTTGLPMDAFATLFCAALMPAGTSIDAADGAPSVPSPPGALAIDCEERYGDSIRFAGRLWAKKEAPLAVGPGGNRFSKDERDVWVDGQGRLHLTIRRHDDGLWHATEVILLESLGHGTYTFRTESQVEDLDSRATFGAFTYDAYGDGSASSPFRELDCEDSRWCDPLHPATSQFVVQPFATPGNLSGYALPDLAASPTLSRAMTWEPGRVEFWATRGNPASGELHRFVYAGPDVPAPGRERVHLNLWLNEVTQGCGPAPPDPQGDGVLEVIVGDFRFTPAHQGR